MDEAGGARARILDAAEVMLRRHGPAKTTVVDVARALRMSHGNVYRHFASKAALQAAVAERWLRSISDPLAAIAAGEEPAPERLRAWVLALVAAKRARVLDDPELFATYHAVAEASSEVVAAHVAELRSQVARIIRDGVARGDFRVDDAERAAAAVVDATARFHHPHLVLQSAGRPVEAAANAVVDLLIAGLRTETTDRPGPG